MQLEIITHLINHRGSQQSIYNIMVVSCTDDIIRTLLKCDMGTRLKLKASSANRADFTDICDIVDYNQWRYALCRTFRDGHYIYECGFVT